MAATLITAKRLETDIAGVHASDRIEVIGNVVKVWRGTTLIGSGTLTLPAISVTPGIAPVPMTLRSLFFIERNPMASGAFATCTKVVSAETGDGYEIFFSDGSSRERSSRASALAALSDVDSDPERAKDLLELAMLRQDPSGSDPQKIVGRTIVVDCAAQNPTTLSVKLEI